ncbi:hypothetical protein ACFL2F_01125 [Myxococcota bacterium]
MEAVFALIGAAVGAVLGYVGTWLNNRQLFKRQDKKDELGKLQGLIADIDEICWIMRNDIHKSSKEHTDYPKIIRCMAVTGALRQYEMNVAIKDFIFDFDDTKEIKDKANALRKAHVEILKKAELALAIAGKIGK